MRLAAALMTFVLLGGSAVAQTAPSTVDAPGSSGTAPQADPKQSSPGATGAMQNTAPTIATSPQDVQEQSKSVGPSGKPVTSPGTVGATPGSDAPQPTPK